LAGGSPLGAACFSLAPDRGPIPWPGGWSLL